MLSSPSHPSCTPRVSLLDIYMYMCTPLAAACPPHLQSAISAEDAEDISRCGTACWNSCALT